MFSKSMLSILVVSVTLGLAACATDADRQQADVSPLNDNVLNDNVIYAVQKVPGVRTDDLNISTRDGVVTLRGHTQTRTQAQDAIEAARHVPGVRKVDYDISVDE